MKVIPLLSAPLLYCVQAGDIRTVRNGFVHDYRRNGYRDVKVFVTLEDHICEIQLHLRSFHSLKDGQHTVYEWSRTLSVTEEMHPHDLFKNVGPDIFKRMLLLAQNDWNSTAGAVPELLLATGRHNDARTATLQVNKHVSGRVSY